MKKKRDAWDLGRAAEYATTPAPKKDRREMMLGEPVRPLKARYATPPPSDKLQWLETAHFMPTDHETVLLAWPRTEGFTFRTGRYNGRAWLLSNDVPPRELPVFFATLNTP